MNVKLSLFVTGVEVIIHLLLYNLQNNYKTTFCNTENV